MTPAEFVKKWRHVELKERSAAQEHFIDLCRLLGHPTPAEADPTGERFMFERGATKISGGDGWADVWKRDFFGWEYKGKRRDLDEAFKQLHSYSLALENPPLLVACDMDRFRIRTNWTATVSETVDLTLGDLLVPEKLRILRDVFFEPDALRPSKTRAAITREAAERFAVVAQRLRSRGHDPHWVAHFVNRLIFCMFAEDKALDEAVAAAYGWPVGISDEEALRRLLEMNRSRAAKLTL
jgi:hypothetical protein